MHGESVQTISKIDKLILIRLDISSCDDVMLAIMKCLSILTTIYNINFVFSFTYVKVMHSNAFYN